MKNRTDLSVCFCIYIINVLAIERHMCLYLLQKHEHVKCLCITENRLKREEK